MGLTQITELNIHEWRADSSREDYSKLINSMPNLTALHCQPFADLECLQLINNPDQIKFLCLDYAHDSCSRLALHRFTHLECLSLTANEKSLSNETLQLLELPSITALDLKSNSQLTGEGISSLKRFEHLRSMNLSCCKNVDDQALQMLLKDTKFTNLFFIGCPKITDKGLAFLASQVSLRSLDFGGSDEIHDISFMQFLPELTTLLIEHAQLDDAPESLPMLVHLKKLILLAIFKAPLINDTAVAALSYMTHLKSFHLSGSGITFVGRAIVKKLNVQEVEWTG